MDIPKRGAKAKQHKGQMPLKLKKARKTDVRTQFAALCYRYEGDKLKVCLITSRRSQRWIIPRGWPMHKQTPADAAATEAWEEAGLTGQAIDRCLGVYAYVKILTQKMLPVIVMVYPLHVDKEHDDWPEARDRRRKWMSPKKAAKRVAEPELRRIISEFDPSTLL